MILDIESGSTKSNSATLATDLSKTQYGINKFFNTLEYLKMSTNRKKKFRETCEVIEGLICNIRINSQ